MATASIGTEDARISTPLDKNQERRSKVVLGSLPDDFLRPDSLSPTSQQEMADHQLAMHLQHQQWVGGHARPSYSAQNYAGQLIITVVEASLTKNYGMTRMDPYVRLRVGHTVYETHAVPSGGKTPRWNKRIQCYLPVGVKSISLEIYDECALTMDELVAYGHIPLPESLFRRESADEWYQLSGKQGENKEGSVHLILSLLPINPSMGFGVPPTYAGYPLSGASVVPVGPTTMTPPVMMVPAYGVSSYAPVTVYSSPTPVVGTVPTAAMPRSAVPVQQPKPLSQEEMKEIESMFPSLDQQVIQSVVDACGGRREVIIDSLLQLSD